MSGLYIIIENDYEDYLYADYCMEFYTTVITLFYDYEHMSPQDMEYTQIDAVEKHVYGGEKKRLLYFNKPY